MAFLNFVLVKRSGLAKILQQCPGQVGLAATRATKFRLESNFDYG